MPTLIFSCDKALGEYSLVPKLNSTNQQQELLVWVVQPTGEITFKQVDLQTLGQSLADFVTDSRDALGVQRSLVGVRPRQETDHQRATRQTQQLQRLYQLLIQPIAQDLPTDPNAPVIFVPQGELFLVPFPALQDVSGHYLIEQHTLLTSPSIQLLEKTQQQAVQVRQANLQDVLVVGNPTMPSVSANIGDCPQQLAALPGAEQEARVLVSLWSVPDAPTAELMTEFYRQFQQTDNKAQALRQAMLTTMAQHPNPRDWAAFTLIGEAR